MVIRPVRTLLLIEDFAPDRELYRRALLSDATATYRVIEADSVSLGLELCQTEAIDAILLDYLMPDADGLRFLELLQAQSNGSSPPVVMVTGEGDEAIAVSAMKLGVEDYLVKRLITPETLQMAIRSAIENARLRRQLREANQQITTIWESMTDAYVTLDQEWRIAYANPAATQVISQLTQLEPAEFLEKTHWEVFPWSVGKITEWEYRRAVAEQVAVHFEFLYEPSGGWFEVHAYPSPVGLGIYFRDISNRKRAEETVRLQLSEIEAIYETAPIGLCFVDTDLRFVRINEQLAEINGLPVSEHLGRTLREILPEMVDQLEPLYRQVIESGESILNLEVQGMNRAQSGVLRHWLVSYHPQKDVHQNVIGVNVTVQEVTDRKHNDQRLRESEARLQLGVQVAGVALARFDYASNTVSLSAEAAALYGIPSDELTVTRDRIHATFHPDERQLMEQHITQVLDPNSDGWFARDHRVVWQTGEVRWLSVRKQVFFDRLGETLRPDYAILAAIDITERKEAEAILQNQLAQIEAIYATAPIGLCFLDRERRFVQLNERLAEINGLSVEEHLGRTVREILPDLAERQEPIFEQVLQTGIPVLDVEVQGLTPAQPGVDRYWLVSYYPLIAAGGEGVGINIMVKEITEQKRAELERSRLLAVAEAARAEAEAANLGKDEFVAIVAHELRSPLNSIAGWSKLLQTRKFDDATLKKALDTIYRNTQAQVQLVEDLLDVTRMVRGTLQINLTPLKLIDVIQAALEIVSPAAEAKQIQIETQLSSVAQISGDVNRLQQIVVNLLTNAIKFTPGSGRVEVSLVQVQDHVQLQVRDTGKGIAAEFLPFIFERFQQGQRNTGAKDGLGLGLSIVKNLVELHQGTIAVESPGTGQGATFTVKFPVLKTVAILSDS
jgi:PAS domain S-box-containing protein